MVGTEGNMLLGKHGDIMKDKLRFEILRALNKTHEITSFHLFFQEESSDFATKSLVLIG